MGRISRVVLGTGTEFTNVTDVQETMQHTGEYVQQIITINLGRNTEGGAVDLSQVEGLFSAEGALTPIKIYTQEEIIDPKTGEIFYGTEILSLETSEYTKLRNLVKQFSNGWISATILK